MRDKIPFPVLITGLVFLGLMGMFIIADKEIADIFTRSDNALLILASKSRNSFWDAVMIKSSSFYFWIPFYCFLLLRLVAHDKVRFLRLVFSIAFYLLICLGSLMLYNMYFRHVMPFYDHAFAKVLKIGPSGLGEVYGCLPLSSAAAGLAILLALFFSKKHFLLNAVIICWALIFIYSRAYNSWNYPSEITFGAIFSLILGYLSYMSYRYYLIKMYAG